MIKATQFKQLHPKDADVKHMGPEPLFLAQPFTEDRKLALMKSLGWYSYYYSNKEAKSFIQSWLINNGNAALSKQFTSVSDNTIIPTYGWLARMNLAGLELTSVENEKILHIVKESIEKNKENIKENAEGKVVSNRPDVQEIMRERARDAAGEIEGIFDDYIITDIRANVKPEIRQILAARNIMAQHINIIKASWNNKLKELELVLTGTDQQLAESYSCYTKTQIKNLVSFCQSILTDLDSYAQNKKAKVNVRRKKPVSIEKLVMKLKYLRTFEEFGLESISPTKIPGSSEMWVYNTKNRKLQYYQADEYARVFTVKGNSILGYDTNKSVQKTLRKPNEVIKELLNCGKPVARKIFADIKATPISVNGRFNENLIILKAS